MSGNAASAADRSAGLPRALAERARWEQLGPSRIPVMIVPPMSRSSDPPPIMLWMHGRTATKELDPGRYLRWIRSGIGACAIDLPGHGERFDADLQQPGRTLDVVMQMCNEIDEVTSALGGMNEWDMNRIGIGGMSAGGMATLLRLCSTHSFRCASVEAISGSWRHQQQREMFRNRSDAEIAALDPIEHLDCWREIPLQAIHARFDEWVAIDGQAAFIEALQRKYQDPSLIEFISYDRTGAPAEHIGFGKFASQAKDAQATFLRRHLQQPLAA